MAGSAGAVRRMAKRIQSVSGLDKSRSMGKYLLARQMNENGLIDIIGRGAAKKYKLK